MRYLSYRPTLSIIGVFCAAISFQLANPTAGAASLRPPIIGEAVPAPSANARRATAPVKLQGASAVNQLKQDGQYDALQTALNQARLKERLADNTPHRRRAPRTSNPAAEPDAYITDPIFTMQQKLLASDGVAWDYFGSAVALSGDTAVIGAYLDEVTHPYQGSVYVFVRSDEGWTEQQKLTASDAEMADNFGLSVAIDGDTIVVGAQVDDVDGTADQGSAYVFTRNGTMWSEQQRLNASDGAPWDYFGNTVAISGDTIAVGAFGDNIGTNTDQGSAYVFLRTGGVWAEKQKLTGSWTTQYDQFGFSVALKGDTMVLGTPFDKMQAFNQGSVYVFARTGGVWMQQQYLASGAGVVNQFFGTAVATNGDTVVVGAYGDNIGPNDAQGSVYVYSRSGTDWMFQKKLTADDGKAYDNFGYSVALSGEFLVVGANFDDVDPNQNQGSAYVFKGSGPTWIQQQKLIAGDGEAFDYFGSEVAISGDTVMVGARLDDNGTIQDQGSVYVFSWSSPSPTLELQPQPIPDGTAGSPYSLTLTATGGAGPYKFGLEGTLPPGLSLTSYGVLSGMPAVDGTWEFRVMIVDANGASTKCATSMTILKSQSEPCPTIGFEPQILPDGIVHKDYSVTLTPTAGKKPITFVALGTLPPGLSLTPDGLLSGTPTQDGTFEFRVLITDGRGCATRCATSITILK